MDKLMGKTDIKIKNGLLAQTAADAQTKIIRREAMKTLEQKYLNGQNMN